MYQIKKTDGKLDTIECLIDQIENACQKISNEDKSLAFAMLVFDFEDAHIKKILADSDYFNALDQIQGDLLTIFYVNSEYVKHQSGEASNSNVMRVELSLQTISTNSPISPKTIASRLINNENLPSPSLLFFKINRREITDYTIAKLRDNKKEDGFNELIKIISTATSTLSKIDSKNYDNKKEIFELLKNSIDGSETWKNINISFKKILKLKDFILFWKI